LSRIDCVFLSNFFNEVGVDENVLNKLATILIYLDEECVGRKRLEHVLGVTERRARSIIDELVSRKILYRKTATCIDDSFRDRYFLRILYGDKGYSMIENVDIELLKTIDRFIHVFRDYLLISLNEPDSIDVIGYYIAGEKVFVFPRVPTEYYRIYIDALKEVHLDKDSILVFWRKYRKYLYEAGVIYSLYKMCSRDRVG